MRGGENMGKKAIHKGTKKPYSKPTIMILSSKELRNSTCLQKKNACSWK